jgi:hypothetical protein
VSDRFELEPQLLPHVVVETRSIQASVDQVRGAIQQLTSARTGR